MQKKNNFLKTEFTDTDKEISEPWNIKVNNLSKHFDNIIALKNISFHITGNKYLCIIGASGSGKTTLLRIIAGLDDPTTGSIFLNNRNLFDMSVDKRNISMVFQDYAIFPHMTVYDNIAVGLKIKKIPKIQIQEKINNVSKLLNIPHLLSRKPRHISGGEQQRVALGRAIIKNPDIFLLDEPLANLDSELRINMRNELKKLQRKVEKTFVHVTHDQFEAFSIADLILLLDKGEIKDFGTPEEIYSNPQNAYSAKFIGFPKINFLKVVLKIASTKVELENTNLTLTFNFSEKINKLLSYKNKEILLGIRPESFSFYLSDNSIKINKGKIFNKEVYGSFIAYTVKIEDNLFNIIDKHNSQYCIDDVVDIYLNPLEIIYFDKNSGINLINNNRISIK
ncbi:MAG: ABC transporter ATP-binding protein [Deferribacteres bacterium]|nr:ABC transporter ATP-binding protein [Deferribacteres bacterium]